MCGACTMKSQRLEGDWIAGNGGDDTLVGYLNADRIYGGAGNDQEWGGEGADLVNGGVGQPAVQVASTVRWSAPALLRRAEGAVPWAIAKCSVFCARPENAAVADRAGRWASVRMAADRRAGSPSKGINSAASSPWPSAARPIGTDLTHTTSDFKSG
jgi:hypothetical protein